MSRAFLSIKRGLLEAVEHAKGGAPEARVHRPPPVDDRPVSLSRGDQCTEGEELRMDTEIRHVTKLGANLFRELGFAAEEAERLQAASRKQINDKRLLEE